MSENYEVMTTAVALECQGEVEQVVLEDGGRLGWSTQAPLSHINCADTLEVDTGAVLLYWNC